jgi:hypothetical protein
MPSLLTITWVILILVCLQELFSTEEKMVHKLELDREKNSVIHLTQAKADCEGIASLHLYLFPASDPQIRRASGDHSVALLGHAD